MYIVNIFFTDIETNLKSVSRDSNYLIQPNKTIFVSDEHVMFVLDKHVRVIGLGF